MKVRHIIATVAALAVVPTLASAQKLNLRYLTAWDDRYQATVLIAEGMSKRIEEITNGRIKMTLSGPEVIKPRQQFQPVSSGVFDMNLAVAPYYIGTTGVPMVGFALHPDTEDWRKKGYWQYFDEEMQRFNQKMILHMTGGTGSDVFQVMLKEPIKKVEKPLAGRKIRANGFYTPIIKPLGGAMVNLNGAEIYSALQKGVVEGAAWPVQGAVDFKWYEVAKYMMRPRFGVSPYTVTMNMDRFKKLSKADQELLLKVGHDMEKELPTVFDEGTDKELRILKEKGVTETHLDADVAKRMIDGFVKGVWNFAITFNKKTSDRTRKLYEMARANGDAPESLK